MVRWLDRARPVEGERLEVSVVLVIGLIVSSTKVTCPMERKLAGDKCTIPVGKAYRTRGGGC
jgi:hypothetical protein